MVKQMCGPAGTINTRKRPMCGPKPGSEVWKKVQLAEVRKANLAKARAAKQPKSEDNITSEVKND